MGTYELTWGEGKVGLTDLDEDATDDATGRVLPDDPPTAPLDVC